jgi:Ca2+-binding RTX toxin-like protein
MSDPWLASAPASLEFSNPDIDWFLSIGRMRAYAYPDNVDREYQVISFPSLLPNRPGREEHVYYAWWLGSVGVLTFFYDYVQQISSIELGLDSNFRIEYSNHFVGGTEGYSGWSYTGWSYQVLDFAPFSRTFGRDARIISNWDDRIIASLEGVVDARMGNDGMVYLTSNSPNYSVTYSSVSVTSFVENKIFDIATAQGGEFENYDPQRRTGFVEDGGQIQFRITRPENASQSAQTLKWFIAGHGPGPVWAQGDDFAHDGLPRGEITFGVNQTEVFINVALRDDRLREGVESFQIWLTSPSMKQQLWSGHFNISDSAFRFFSDGDDFADLNTLSEADYARYIADPTLYSSAGAGNDYIIMPDGPVRDRWFDASQPMRGGSGNDTFLGSNRGEQLFGEDGDDYFVDGTATSATSSFPGTFFNGGNGIDTVDYSAKTLPVFVDLMQRILTEDAFLGIENVFGGSSDDILYGDWQQNHLRGNHGDDTIFGDDGNDTIDGGGGSDKLGGGKGADSIFGDWDHDSLSGGEDHDVLIGAAGHDCLLGGDGDDSLNGGTDADTMYGGDGDDTIVDDDDFAIGYRDSLFGEGGNDSLAAGVGRDFLSGFSGSDTLNAWGTTEGSLSGDTLLGGSGTDLFFMDHDDFLLDFGLNEKIVVRIDPDLDLGNAIAIHEGLNTKINFFQTDTSNILTTIYLGTDSLGERINLWDLQINKSDSGVSVEYLRSNIKEDLAQEMKLLDRNFCMGKYVGEFALGVAIEEISTGKLIKKAVVSEMAGEATRKFISNFELSVNLPSVNLPEFIRRELAIANEVMRQDLANAHAPIENAFLGYFFNKAAQSIGGAAADAAEVKCLAADGLWYGEIAEAVMGALGGRWKVAAITSAALSAAIKIGFEHALTEIELSDSELFRKIPDSRRWELKDDYRPAPLQHDTYETSSRRTSLLVTEDQIANATATEKTDVIITNVEKVTLPEGIEEGLLSADSSKQGRELNGNAANNKLWGNALDNKLSGGAGDDIVYGGAGNDSLSGDEGNDSLFGGDGNDSFFINEASDFVIEHLAEGADTIITSLSMAIPDHIEALRIATDVSGVTLTGGAGNDMLIGNGFANTFNGGAGDDVILAGNVTLADIYALFAT